MKRQIRATLAALLAMMVLVPINAAHAAPDTTLKQLVLSVTPSPSAEDLLTVTPTFSAGTTTYSASVPYLTTSINLVAAANSDTATISATLGSTNVAPGSSTISAGIFGFSETSGVLTIDVTSDSTTATYTINITRNAPSSNNQLSALTFVPAGGSNVISGFAPATESYSASVAYPSAAITVNATKQAATASVEIGINSGSDVRNVTGATATFTPIVGSANVVTVKVTAQNGSLKTYTVTVTRAAPLTASTIDTLTIYNVTTSANVTLSPAFGTSGLNTYSADIAANTDSITVTPAFNPAKFATYEISAIRAGENVTINAAANTPLRFAPLAGDNVVVVRGIAQNGTSITLYTITLREPVSTTPATPAAPTVIAGDRSVTIYAAALPTLPAATSFTASLYNASLGFVNSCVITGASGSCSISGLTNGTTYYASLVARNSSFSSAASNYSSGTIPTALPSVPNKPTVTAGVGNVTIAVTNSGLGSAPTRIDVAAYTSTNIAAGNCVILAASGSCVISGLSSSIQYKFDAISSNTLGVSATRSPMSDLISPIGLPNAPVKPIAVAGNQEVTITVSALASGSPATSFTITASPNVGGKTCTVTGSSGSCKITGLINGTGYIFSAVAVNLAGTSPVSPSSDRVVPIAATPSPTPTPMPTPTPTPTPKPSASPTPSPSPSATPVVAPNAKLRLLFANGSSTLSVLARRQLDNVIGKIVDSVIDIQVLANGTIATGKITAKEKALSLKRAQAVAKYLQNQGLYGTYKVKGGVVSTPASTAKNSVLVTLYWTFEK